MKLIKTASFRAKVRVNYPHPEQANETIPFEFEAEFRNLRRSELRRLPDTVRQAEDGHVLHEVLLAVRGIEGEDGSPMDPKLAAEAVIEDAFLSQAAAAVYQAELAKVRTKN